MGAMDGSQIPPMTDAEIVAALRGLLDRFEDRGAQDDLLRLIKEEGEAEKKVAALTREGDRLRAALAAISQDEPCRCTADDVICVCHQALVSMATAALRMKP